MRPGRRETIGQRNISHPDSFLVIFKRRLPSWNRTVECPELERTHEDHRVQPLNPWELTVITSRMLRRLWTLSPASTSFTTTSVPSCKRRTDHHHGKQLGIWHIWSISESSTRSPFPTLSSPTRNGPPLQSGRSFPLCPGGSVPIQATVFKHHSRSDKLKEIKSQFGLGGDVTCLSLLCNN